MDRRGARGVCVCVCACVCGCVRCVESKRGSVVGGTSFRSTDAAAAYSTSLTCASLLLCVADVRVVDQRPRRRVPAAKVSCVFFL